MFDQGRRAQDKERQTNWRWSDKRLAPKLVFLVLVLVALMLLAVAVVLVPIGLCKTLPNAVVPPRIALPNGVVQRRIAFESID